MTTRKPLMDVRVSRRSLLLGTVASMIAVQTGAARTPTWGAGRPASSRKSALVIGAGMSGLAAAQRLQSRGVSVTVLEARNRLGRRVFTDTSLGAPVDLGAAWLIGKNPLYDLLRKNNVGVLPPSDFEAIDLFDLDGSALGTKARLSAGIRAHYIETLIGRWNRHNRRDRSVGQVLEEFGAFDGLRGSDFRVSDYFLNLAFDLDYACDADRFSARQFATYETQYGAEERFVPGGLSRAVDLLSAKLDVRLATPVRKIYLSDTSVTVHTDEELFTADGCIVSVPLGVLKQNRIAFSPALPEPLLRAITTIGMGSFFKLAMRFDTAFWNPKSQFIGVLAPTRSRGKGQHATFVDVSQSAGHPVLVMFLGSDLADTFEARPISEVTHFAMSQLRTAFGEKALTPRAVVGTDWKRSEFSSGAYSYYAVGTGPESTNQFSKLINGRMTFAGEHTSTTNFGTVHGAYNSGIKAADRLMDNSGIR